MSFKRTLILSLCLFLAGYQSVLSQLSGVVNLYTKVTAVDYVCSSVTVSSTTGFAAGDKVLLIQMQGATINSTANNTSFGDITAIGDAGNYEFAVIDHFTGNVVYFVKTLLRTYTPAGGSVQLITVPQYDAVSVDGELTAKAWDGTTGGVIVFESSSILTLNANINANAQGFRGGAKSPDGGDCSTFPTAYFTSFPTVQAGQKGEGIAAYITGKESARGKNSIGGGGGNSHNTGGGGGGNYGAGGRGGNSKCGTNPYGYGGLGLGATYYNATSNKIFLGGGGGGGQVNNSTSFNGGNGGGLIIIKAASIVSNGHTITANGGSVDSYYTTTNPFGSDNGDGNSGGGAGGTILLDIPTYPGALTLQAVGGRGGDTGYLNNNFGPGGGGSGGVVWLSTTLPVSLSAEVAFGFAGISGTPQPPPPAPAQPTGLGTSNGATNGGAGIVLSSLSLPQSTSTSSCALPVELLSFQVKATGKYQVALHWSTATEVDNDHFAVEKSTDGIHFIPLTKIQGHGNTTQQQHYVYHDDVTAYDVLYYRLWQTDINGTTTNLGIKSIHSTEQNIIEGVYPNPFEDKLFLKISGKQDVVPMATFTNALGELTTLELQQEGDLFYLNTITLSQGMYSLLLQWPDRYEVIKVIKN